jgi:hypothetical protein
MDNHQSSEPFFPGPPSMSMTPRQFPLARRPIDDPLFDRPGIVRGCHTVGNVGPNGPQDPVPPNRLQPNLPRDLQTICLKPHDLADVRYQAARESMSRILDHLDAPRVAGVPRLEEVRQETQENMLAFYQRVLEHADSPDRAVRLDAAFAYEQTGGIQDSLGRESGGSKLPRQSSGNACESC